MGRSVKLGGVGQESVTPKRFSLADDKGVCLCVRLARRFIDTVVMSVVKSFNFSLQKEKTKNEVLSLVLRNAILIRHTPERLVSGYL